MKTKLFKDQQQRNIVDVNYPNDLMYIVKLIRDETYKAEGKHPDLANSFADALLVINEELGEANRAYLQYQYEGGNWEEIRKELIQTGAMVFRVLLNLEQYVEDIALTRIAEASKETLRGASPFKPVALKREPTKTFSDIWDAILQSENEQVLADLKTPGNVSASKEIYEQQIGRGLRTFSSADVERVAIRISDGITLCDSIGCPDCSKYRYEAKKYLINHPEEWMTAKENACKVNPYNFQAELYASLTGGEIAAKSDSVPVSPRGFGKMFTRKEIIQNLYNCTNPGGSFGLIIGRNTNIRIYRGKTGNRIVYSMINPMREDYDAFEEFLQDHRAEGFRYAHNSGVVMPDGKYKFNEVYKSDKSPDKPKS